MDLDDAVRAQGPQTTQLRDLTNKILYDVGNFLPGAGTANEYERFSFSHQ